MPQDMGLEEGYVPQVIALLDNKEKVILDPVVAPGKHPTETVAVEGLIHPVAGVDMELMAEGQALALIGEDWAATPVAPRVFLFSVLAVEAAAVHGRGVTHKRATEEQGVVPSCSLQRKY